MEGRKFPWRKTFLLGFGFLGISILWPIFNQYIPLFLQSGNPEFAQQLAAEGRTMPDIKGIGFALSPALAFFIMTWDNIINVFVQPWVGERSDRTRSRFGKRKPWVMIGAPIALLGFVFIPVAQTVIAIMVAILVTNFGMALFRSPTIAWLGDHYKPEERSKANGVINLMGGIGGLLAFFGGGLLFKYLGRDAPFIAGAIMMALVLVVVLKFLKEPKEEGQQIHLAEEPRVGVLKNLKTVFTNSEKSGLWVLVSILFWFMAYSALDTGLSSFAVFTLGIEPGTASILASAANVAFMLFAVPAGFLAIKFSRRTIILWGLSGLVVVFLLGYFFIGGVVTLVIALILTGFFWALVNVNSLPLVYDYGDERKIGAYTGLYYFSSQMAAILGPTLGGILVDVVGNQYRWLFLFGAVFMALAWVTMTRVKNVRKIEA
jgi:maltose/moltooligosaccharide transporter